AAPEPAPAIVEAAPATAMQTATHAMALEEPGGIRPGHVVEQAVQAAGEWTGGEPAQPGQAAGTGDGAGPHLKITLRGVGEKDQELLAEELGNLGNIVGQVKGGGDLTLCLAAEGTSDDIIAVCCFVIDESQISIGRGTAPVDETEQGEPGTPEADS